MSMGVTTIQSRSDERRSTAPLNAVSLRKIFMHVTRACNLRCSYCYLSGGKPLHHEMSTNDFSDLWPEIVEVRPAKVVFTGGEPLLRPDIVDLLGGLRHADPEHNVLRCLNTNGHLVTPKLAGDLVGLVDEIWPALSVVWATPPDIFYILINNYGYL